MAFWKHNTKNLLRDGSLTSASTPRLSLALWSARRTWAESVLVDLDRAVHTGGEVVFIAGARYREFLQAALEKRGVSVRILMDGLDIGLQLQRLTAKLNEPKGANLAD